MHIAPHFVQASGLNQVISEEFKKGYVYNGTSL